MVWQIHRHSNVNDHPKDIHLETDSEESDIDFCSEIMEIITGIDKVFNHILRMLKIYLEA